MKNEEFSDEKLREKLGKKSYRVLREKHTEPPFSSALLKNKEKGVYECKVCGSELFSSSSKFDSGTGWPSFTKAIQKNVELREDTSYGMVRNEVVCKKCKSHLGHVFEESTPTGKRYCINGLSLEFKKT